MSQWIATESESFKVRGGKVSGPCECFRCLDVFVRAATVNEKRHAPQDLERLGGGSDEEEDEEDGDLAGEID